MPKTQKTFDRSWGLVFKYSKVWGGTQQGLREGLGGTLYPGPGLGISGGSIGSRALN